MVWENFQICSVQITGNAFSSQKIDSRHFYLSSPGQTFTQVLIITPKTGESYSFPPQTAVFLKKYVSPEKKKGG